MKSHKDVNKSSLEAKIFRRSNYGVSSRYKNSSARCSLTHFKENSVSLWNILTDASFFRAAQARQIPSLLDIPASTRQLAGCCDRDVLYAQSQRPCHIRFWELVRLPTSVSSLHFLECERDPAPFPRCSGP